MIDIFDIIHLLIGSIIVSFIIWIIIKTHLYFSKDNIPLEVLLNNKNN